MASILVFSPHPDDAELGMGGTIIRLKSQGHKVHIVDLTDGEPTPFGSVEIRAKEKAAAAEVLGVERTLVGLKNREVQHTIEARHRVAAVIRQHRADWLFVPYPVDAHPDHRAISQICIDARFDAKLTKSTIPGEPYHPKRIIYYYCTHLLANFDPNFCVDITDQIEQKIRSVECYPSQFTGKSGHVPEMVRTITAYFGTRIGTKYAEPFKSMETLGFTGLGELF